MLLQPTGIVVARGTRSSRSAMEKILFIDLLNCDVNINTPIHERESTNGGINVYQSELFKLD